MRKLLFIAAGISASAVAFSLRAPPGPIDLVAVDYVIHLNANPANDVYPLQGAPDVLLTPTNSGTICDTLYPIATGAPKAPQRCGTYGLTPDFGPAITGTWVFYDDRRPTGGWNPGNIYWQDRMMMTPDTGNVLWSSKFRSDPTVCVVNQDACPAGQFKFCGDVDFYDITNTTVVSSGEFAFCAAP